MFLKLAAPIVIAACAAGPALAQSAPDLARPTMLIHGNYCGPGNNAPAAPIDALDAACARHDACTPDGAAPSKACNLRLQTEAEFVAKSPREPEDLRMLAGLVASAAAMMPSRPSHALAKAVTLPASHVSGRPSAMHDTAPEPLADDDE